MDNLLPLNPVLPRNLFCHTLLDAFRTKSKASEVPKAVTPRK